MTEAYAHALWSCIQNSTDPKAAVEGLIRVLKKRGHMRLLRKIASSFAVIARQALGRNTMTLLVADTSHAHAALKEAEAYLGGVQAQKERIETRVDETLIGGWRLEGRGRLIDASYKTRLLEIYERITNA